MKFRGLPPLLIAIGLAVPCLSQETTGDFEGRMLDESGYPVVSANILVTGPSLQGARENMTNADGYFRVPVLPVGEYTVEITHANYKRVTLKSVGVRLGRTTSLGDIRLLRVDERVVVVARRQTIDPTSTSLGANLDPSEFEYLPLERDYRSIPILLPHVNQSFLGDEINYAGATGFENKYFIDGVEVTDPFLGNTGTNLPYNFVQEIQVRMGGYEAEYRSSLGAVVNVITPSGSSEFHAKGFGFFTNNRVGAEPRQAVFEPPQGDFAQYDVGLSVAGPIVREKLSYAAAYNPTFEREDVYIPGIAAFEDKNTRHVFTGKLAWRATDATNLSLTVIGDPARRDGVGDIFVFLGTPISFKNPDPYLADIEEGGVDVLASGVHFLGTNAFLEASASVLTRTMKFEPATAVGRDSVLFIEGPLFGPGVWSGGYPVRVDNSSFQMVFDVSGSVSLGRHTLKTGLAYKDNRFESNETDRALWLDPADSQSVYIQLDAVIKGTVHNRIPSVFIQDSWQLTDRLRLNFGLRWDGQFLVDSNGDVAQRITDQYQPRAGFMYQPGELGTHKIFGSFGRFYQELSTHLGSVEHSDGVSGSLSFYDCDPRFETCDPFFEDSFGSAIHEEVDGLEGQHYDEFTLGYEWLLGSSYKVGTRGVYRTLRQGIETLEVEPGSGEFAIGNPGKGLFSDWPKMKREYTSLELSLRKSPDRNSSFIASYVWSKAHGNYSGLFNSDLRLGFPNVGTWDYLENLENAEGLLPNDRTHVFKFSGSYRFDLGLAVGGAFLWQSGTPLSEFAPATTNFQDRFISQRGKAGRTPWLWDLSLRFGYELPWSPRAKWNQRLILDVLHIGGQREPVDFEQRKFLGVDDSGNPTNPSPFYLQPLRFQPPMTIRLGAEVGF